MSKIIVIGGGAAGMMAAIAAAEQSNDVILLEQNEKLGKKVFITGKGRCNVTNACEVEDLFQNIVSNPKFLYSSIYEFDNMQVMKLMEEAGCSLKIERGERVFPVSDHSSDVIKALDNKMRSLHVAVHLNTRVTELLTKEIEAENEKSPSQEVTGVRCKDGTIYTADAVILATGGVSYPLCGSTGEGIRLAEKLGHKVVEMKPSLVPFEIKENWCKELQGVSLKNVTVTMMCGKKKAYEGFGEMLFTHFGVSGPLILTASCHYHKAKNHDDCRLLLDMKPALSKEQLDKRLLREFENNQNKAIKNVIDSLLPSKMVPVFIRLLDMDPNKKIHEVTKEERFKMIELLKELPMTVIGTRDFREAIITQGGISVKNVNPSTMESKLVKNLYLAGEMLDVDAYTGGFNLQIAWSTGHLAGVHAGNEER